MHTRKYNARPIFQRKEGITDKIKNRCGWREKDLLCGIKRILEQSDQLKVSLCTYHKKNDFQEFKNLFEELNFNVHSSNGYMIFYLDEPLEEPYLPKHCYLHQNNHNEKHYKKILTPLL